MSAVMHVAFFNRSFYPDGTATSQLLTDLCEALVDTHGYRVSVVAGPALAPVRTPAGTAARHPGVRRETRNGVNILRTWATRRPHRRPAGRFTNYVSYFLSACHAGLGLDRPDIVVALTDPPIIGLAALLAARRARARFVMVYQDVFPEVGALLEDFRSPLVDAVLQRVNRRLVGAADRVVAIGETMCRRLVEGKGADPARTVVIHNWADCARIVPGPRRNPFATAHGLTDRFVVMHSGNVGLSQNLDVLVEAAAHLRDLGDLIVVFVGDGVRRSALEQATARRGLRNVLFLPYQPRERLVESFATADCFVVSLKPGLAGYIVPSKLYAILAAGRPFVAAVEPEAEPAVIARTFACGVHAVPGDAGSLAEGIRALYMNRDESRRMGQRARLASAGFDRRVSVDAYHAVFESLVRGAA
jgi:glycosyltransferase involved in cell wall biosynthesis